MLLGRTIENLPLFLIKKVFESSLFSSLGACTLLRSYQRISPEPRRTCPFHNRPVFTGRSCQHLAHVPSWRTTPCRLFASAYSIYPQTASMLKAVPPTATCGRPCCGDRDTLIIFHYSTVWRRKLNLSSYSE
jgi:hypothetical protein